MAVPAVVAAHVPQIPSAAAEGVSKEVARVAAEEALAPLGNSVVAV